MGGSYCIYLRLKMRVILLASILIRSGWNDVWEERSNLNRPQLFAMATRKRFFSTLEREEKLEEFAASTVALIEGADSSDSESEAEAEDAVIASAVKVAMDEVRVL